LTLFELFFSSYLVARAWHLGEASNFNLSPEEYSTMVVSGYQVKKTYLTNIIQNEINSLKTSSQAKIDCGDWTGRKNYSPNLLDCYIIDDFGYVFLERDR
jgi:hypothetical protein